MIKPRHLWISGGLLLLSGLLVPMASFAEGESVPYARNDILGPVFISTSDTRGSAIGPPPFGQSTNWPHHEHATSPTTVPDQLFPVNQYSHNESTGQASINVLGGEPANSFQSQRSLWENSPHAFPFYGTPQGTIIKTHSLTEAVLIIGVYVVMGILSPNCERNKSWYPGKPFDYRCDK